jgi:hypothetical protein
MVSPATFLKNRLNFQSPINGGKQKRKRKPMWTDVMIAWATVVGAIAGSMVAGLAIWAAYSPAEESKPPTVVITPSEEPDSVAIQFHDSNKGPLFRLFRHRRD